MALVRVGDMSTVCAFCRTEGSSTTGQWFVCPDCAGGRSPPIAVYETCADSGSALSLGAWAPTGAAHSRCRTCNALDSARHSEAAVEEYRNKCDPLSARKDIFVVGPPRASSAELRCALFRAKEHLPPANTSGLEDVMGQGSEVPSNGTSLLLTSAQICGSGTRAEQVATESVDRLRLSREPHMKYKY